MVKLNFIEKLFKKNNEKIDEVTDEKIDDTNEEKANEDILLTHNEVLYSSEKKKQMKKTKELKTITEQRTWRDIKGIENKIDKLSKNKIKDVNINTKLNKKVDTIITKKKKHRKPANVIYVVSKPQPGQVKGDWAVRSHGKIFSHHRTKENAIKTARIIARKKEATVLVQNTNGTFSEGFKPRPKSK
jgi:hypothetical protein